MSSDILNILRCFLFIYVYELISYSIAFTAILLILSNNICDTRISYTTYHIPYYWRSERTP